MEEDARYYRCASCFERVPITLEEKYELRDSFAFKPVPGDPVGFLLTCSACMLTGDEHHPLTGDYVRNRSAASRTRQQSRAETGNLLINVADVLLQGLRNQLERLVIPMSAREKVFSNRRLWNRATRTPLTIEPKLTLPPRHQTDSVMFLQSAFRLQRRIDDERRRWYTAHDVLEDSLSEMHPAFHRDCRSFASLLLDTANWYAHPYRREGHAGRALEWTTKALDDFFTDGGSQFMAQTKEAMKQFLKNITMVSASVELPRDIKYRFRYDQIDFNDEKIENYCSRLNQVHADFLSMLDGSGHLQFFNSVFADADEPEPTVSQSVCFLVALFHFILEYFVPKIFVSVPDALVAWIEGKPPERPWSDYELPFEQDDEPEAHAGLTRFIETHSEPQIERELREMRAKLVAYSTVQQSGGASMDLMCPQCKYGPIYKTNCDDMESHHGKNIPEQFGRSYSDNRCENPKCRFFAALVNEKGRTDPDKWMHWDGLPRFSETGVFPIRNVHPAFEQMQHSGDYSHFHSAKPPRQPCWPYLDTPGLAADAMPTCEPAEKEALVQRLLALARRSRRRRPSRSTRRGAADRSRR